MDKRSCADGNMDIYIYIYVHGWKHAVHAVFTGVVSISSLHGFTAQP